jgi:hypothetical protein
MPEGEILAKLVEDGLEKLVELTHKGIFGG